MGTGYTRNRSESTLTVKLPGPSCRSHNPNPYYRAADQVRAPTMFQAAGSLYQPQAGLGSAAETGTKIYVSNLDYGVSNEDIKVVTSTLRNSFVSIMQSFLGRVCFSLLVVGFVLKLE
ncbi:hypothetical protein CDL15_Pgr020841 [Punica granatum]|uniref:RRM domain-containing protein n=1 Tax=Punica granatum TaxID=22663 RepID=A0A218XV23_PUNGR|nr:hypothetical protein CDL15_Pgr020841 [Punica granatum]